jgi:LAO/AO transport system kinase
MPDAGGDVQAIKAGIMEIADVFVINKSDQPGADRLEREIRAHLSLAMRPDHWMPPVVHTVASEGTGIEEALDQTFRFLERGRSQKHAVALWSLRLKEMLRKPLLERFSEADFNRAAVEVDARRQDPYVVIGQPLSRRHD